MSKKRTSAESKNDEQTNEDGSESQLQKEGNAAKRAKLDLLSDTTLEDLPIELFECILVKVVTLEVWDLKLAKSVWKEKADVVLRRLSAVCPHWSSILTSALFRNELHRVLDGTAQEIRLKLYPESPIHLADRPIRALVLLKGQAFALHRPNNRDCICSTYTHNDVHESMQDIVPLPETDVVCIAACEMSNCLYVGLRNKNCRDPSIVRFSRDENHQFNMLLKYHKLPISTMSVAANGNLIILSVQEGEDPSVVSIYDANGSLQKEIMILSSESDIDAHRYKNVIQKSNGNLVLAYVNDQDFKMKLMEIDTNGSAVREYQSSFSHESFVNFAGSYDRILIADPIQGIELLDSEFNLLGVYTLEQDKGQDYSIPDLQYNRRLQHIVRVHFDRNTQTSCVTFFRFAEE